MFSKNIYIIYNKYNSLFDQTDAFRPSKECDFLVVVWCAGLSPKLLKGKKSSPIAFIMLPGTAVSVIHYCFAMLTFIMKVYL